MHTKNFKESVESKNTKIPREGLSTMEGRSNGDIFENIEDFVVLHAKKSQSMSIQGDS
jgi:hypothetical protein